MIAVETTLVAESAGLRLRIEGAGNVLRCRLDGDTTQFLVTVRRSGKYLSTLRLLIPLLVRAGLRIDFVAGRSVLGAAGSGVKQNALGRLLRLPSARIGS